MEPRWIQASMRLTKTIEQECNEIVRFFINTKFSPQFEKKAANSAEIHPPRCGETTAVDSKSKSVLEDSLETVANTTALISAKEEFIPKFEEIVESTLELSTTDSDGPKRRPCASNFRVEAKKECTTNQS